MGGIDFCLNSYCTSVGVAVRKERKVNSRMATLDIRLPPYTQVRVRNGYSDVYFIIHPHYRPTGWKATYHLGRTDRDAPEAIAERAQKYYDELMLFRGEGVCRATGKALKGTLPDVIAKYRVSYSYTDLRPTTSRNYDYYIQAIEAWSEEMEHPHVSELTVPVLARYLNSIPSHDKQRRMRTVLKVLLRTAVLEGYIPINPVNEDLKLRKRKVERRKIVLWTDEEVDRFIAKADAMGLSSMGTAVLIGYETSQRQGDVLSLEKPRDYDGGRFVVQQSKTGKEVRIKATKRLQERLAALPDEQRLLVVNETTNRPYARPTFHLVFSKIAYKAGLPDHIFQQLRHSAIANLQRAGNTIPEIAAVTGHNRSTVTKMLDSHYGIDRDEEMAANAIDRLEKYRAEKAQKK